MKEERAYTTPEGKCNLGENNVAIGHEALKSEITMKEQEILESNKLIAEFDGFKFINDNPEFCPNGYFVIDSEEGYHNQTNPDELKYHSSWDWLMPVIDRIESLENERFQIEIYSKGRCQIFDKGYELFEGYSDTKLKAVYEGVVQFIKWYNQKKA